MLMFLRNKPLQMVLAVMIAAISGPYMNLEMISFFFSISTILKEILMWILPFLIFFCLSSVLSSFKKSAPLMVISTLGLVFIANGIPPLLGYSVGSFFLPSLCNNTLVNIKDVSTSVHTLFSLPIKSFIKNDWALFCGLLFGISVSFLTQGTKDKIFSFLNAGKQISLRTLQQLFIPFLPFYIFGFILKMQYDGQISLLLHSYSKVFILTLICIATYIFVMYLFASGFNFAKQLTYVKNMLPAGLTGFSTMSGIATLPVSLEGVEKNILDKKFTQFIVPTTVNIHMAGDGFNITLTALSLLLMTNNPLPNFSMFAMFIFYYSLTKFSAVGTPGGGVLVVLPVVQEFFGLSPELAGLLATIYILQDSFMTCSNVMVNGALSIISFKLFRKLGIYKLNM
jgi:Na+/H+-dicarboxylate symporter